MGWTNSVVLNRNDHYKRENHLHHGNIVEWFKGFCKTTANYYCQLKREDLMTHFPKHECVNGTYLKISRINLTVLNISLLQEATLMQIQGKKNCTIEKTSFYCPSLYGRIALCCPLFWVKPQPKPTKWTKKVMTGWHQVVMMYNSISRAINLNLEIIFFHIFTVKAFWTTKDCSKWILSHQLSNGTEEQKKSMDNWCPDKD